MRWKRVVVILLPLVSLIWISTWFPVMSENGELDNHSGSTREWDEWFFVFKSDVKYKSSELEGYYKSLPGFTFEHDWECYMNTSKSIYGKTLILASGSPNSCLTMLHQKQFIEMRTEEELKDFYQLLGSGNRKAVLDEVYNFQEEMKKLRRESR